MPTDERSGDVDRERDLDHHFDMLLNGLRTTLPGVQVLFAFLLTLPLQQRFSELDDLERAAYMVALVSAATASVLLIAPSVHQRLRAPVDGMSRKHHSHLRSEVRLAIGGSVLAAVALLASLLLVTELVLSRPWAFAITGAVAGLVLWGWFYLPIVAYSRDEQR